jgi:hypothetical protein
MLPSSFSLIGEGDRSDNPGRLGTANRARLRGALMTRIFDDGDDAYQRWMIEHPSGFVANTQRNTTSRYFVIHRSGCWHITKYNSAQLANPFTRRTYIKVCSDERDEILRWFAAERPRAEKSVTCRSCSGR